MFNRQIAHPFFRGSLKSRKMVDDFGLLNVQEHFLRMLALEQKRTDRSNEPFMLMLIDISKLIQWNYTPKIMKKLLSTIHQATRETDVKGWYHFHKIIGVIYTEFDNNHIENILNKMKTSLQGILIPEHRPLISVSHIVFPEDLNMGKNKFLNVSAA